MWLTNERERERERTHPSLLCWVSSSSSPSSFLYFCQSKWDFSYHYKVQTNLHTHIYTPYMHTNTHAQTTKLTNVLILGFFPIDCKTELRPECLFDLYNIIYKRKKTSYASNDWSLVTLTLCQILILLQTMHPHSPSKYPFGNIFTAWMADSGRLSSWGGWLCWLMLLRVKKSFGLFRVSFNLLFNAVMWKWVKDRKHSKCAKTYSTSSPAKSNFCLTLTVLAVVSLSSYMWSMNTDVNTSLCGMGWLSKDNTCTCVFVTIVSPPLPWTSNLQNAVWPQIQCGVHGYLCYVISTWVIPQ